VHVGPGARTPSNVAPFAGIKSRCYRHTCTKNAPSFPDEKQTQKFSEERAVCSLEQHASKTTMTRKGHRIAIATENDGKRHRSIPYK